MTPFSEQEIAEIHDLFGLTPEQLDLETFKTKLRELRAKYHPDNFEKFGDALVRQLATDRFQHIERLAEKLEKYGFGKTAAIVPGSPVPGAASSSEAAIIHPLARFAYQAMKIEIRTGDKDLKYHLFSTFYRWLMLGERFKIPGAEGAYLIADEGHAGRNIGYVEFIRVYLTFEENDPVETIVGWLHEKIAGRADLLLIEGEIVPIEYGAMLRVVKMRSLKALTARAE
ncbi:MAG: hypothetical protein ABIQ93_17600 [Saprospiraceae bacterium]